MDAQTLDGVYSLRGIQDMAAGFRFTTGGRFDFFYIYGATDRTATGTYILDGQTVKLQSDKAPGMDFQVTSQDKKGKGYTILIRDPNEYLRQYVTCIYIHAGKQGRAESDRDGSIRIDVPSVDTLYLRHELFPDIPTLIKDAQNDHHTFEVTLLPSLGQVSFKGIDLFLDGDTLTCYPNYFMPFEDIRFEKE